MDSTLRKAFSPMRPTRWMLRILLLALATTGLWAQERETPARPADLRRDIEQAYRRGQYESVINLTSDVIEATERPDPYYQYMRGMAAYNIGWFAQAEADMAPLAEGDRARQWPEAAKVVDRVGQLRAIGPQRIHEVRDGPDVLFRVYYDEDDKWTRALIAALGDAHRVVSDFYGTSMTQTAVFVFADKDRRSAFSRVLFGQEPSEWAWASGANGMLFFCPYAPGYETRQSASQLPDTVAHEFSHCLTHRVLGTAAMPKWLDEGLAMHCASLVREAEVQENDIAITRMWTAGRIMPLDVITDDTVYRDPETAVDAYPQGYAMVRFALSVMGRDGLLAMLNDLKSNGQFKPTMEQTWNGGMTGFYDDWHDATERRVEKFK